jgi:hypothetical protein
MHAWQAPRAPTVPIPPPPATDSACSASAACQACTAHARRLTRQWTRLGLGVAFAQRRWLRLGVQAASEDDFVQRCAASVCQHSHGPRTRTRSHQLAAWLPSCLAVGRMRIVFAIGRPPSACSSCRLTAPRCQPTSAQRCVKAKPWCATPTENSQRRQADCNLQCATCTEVPRREAGCAQTGPCSGTPCAVAHHACIFRS